MATSAKIQHQDSGTSFGLRLNRDTACKQSCPARYYALSHAFSSLHTATTTLQSPTPHNGPLPTSKKSDNQLINASAAGRVQRRICGGITERCGRC